MATPDEKPIAPLNRPGAHGHRFGPGLRCDECGMSWEEHQRDPQPCVGKPQPLAPPPDPDPLADDD